MTTSSNKRGVSCVKALFKKAKSHCTWLNLKKWPRFKKNISTGKSQLLALRNSNKPSLNVSCSFSIELNVGKECKVDDDCPGILKCHQCQELGFPTVSQCCLTDQGD